jgi:hypothetical protein
MADGVNSGANLERATEDAAERRFGVLGFGGQLPPGGRVSSPHASKFQVATITLVTVAICALLVAGAVIAGGNGSSTTSSHWSSWSPPDNGKLGATEIAEHVAPLYRQTSAQQLDVVTLMNVDNPNSAGTTTGSGYEVAVDQGTSGSSSLSSLELLGGNTIAYDVCGIGGANCGLGGTPSSDRLLLLRREALELALYTFKYISGIDNVIAVLPPGHTETTSTLSAQPPSGSATGSVPVTVAVLFVKQELQPWLDEPLSDTLAEFPPAVSELPVWVKTEEAGLVDQVTERGLYSEKIASQQDGSDLLVLSSLPPS